MTGFLARADEVLRARPAVLSGSGLRRRLVELLVLMAGCGFVYGVVMGGYGGGRWLQMLYSGLKVPLLIAATFLISLPSFFVFNTLLGLRRNFPTVLRALAATQAGLTIILASFAPLTAFWYASVGDYQAAKLFNLAMFGMASVTAQLVLKRFYRPLIAANPRHRLALRVWLVIYAFVGVQMGWVLRPFIGSPEMATRFFREGAWGNAYVEVFRAAARLISP